MGTAGLLEIFISTNRRIPSSFGSEGHRIYRFLWEFLHSQSVILLLCLFQDDRLTQISIGHSSFRPFYIVIFSIVVFS